MNWLQSFADFHRGLDRPEFQARFPHPFLVIRVLLQGDRNKTESTTAPLSADDPGLSNAPLEILPVKSQRGLAAVDLGRARDNDLVLRSGFISARHARFDQENGTWSVTDLGSKNGTAVQFKVLKADAPQAIESGAQLIFGGAFQATFYSSDGLYDYMQHYYWFDE